MKRQDGSEAENRLLKCWQDLAEHIEIAAVWEAATPPSPEGHQTVNVTQSERISRWLEPDPNRSGAAEWRVADTGLPAWRALGQFAVDLGLDRLPDLERLTISPISPAQIKDVVGYYDVPSEALLVAFDHCRLHPAEVIARLIVDRAAFQS